MPIDDRHHHLRAAWYVPPCEKGGGGFRTILQNAQALSRRGFINDFYVVPSYGSGIDVSQMSRDCMQWFGMAPDRWFIAGSNEEARDISIATAWNTAAWADVLPCKAVFYFIQDYEPWFLPLNADRLEAEQSYRKGFAHIALGRWLATRVSTFTPDVPCPYIDFGVSPIYVQCEQARDSHAICAIYQPEKDRRVAPLLIEALEIALKLNPSLHVYLYGSHEQAPIASKQVTSLGIISPEECVELYNRCACGVSLSTSNPSRIPFEMMSCGLPVVDIYRPSNLYDFSDGAIRLVEANAASLAGAIVDLVVDVQLQKSMRAQAHNMMQGRSLEHESTAFAHYIEEYLEKGSFSTELPSVSYTNAAYTANEHVIGVYKESLTAKHALLHDMNVPICCKHGGLHIEIKADDTYGDLRVACWSQPTQSDIQWISLSYADGSYRADVPLVESQIHKAVLHMHFYARKDAEDTRIGILDVPVSFNTDSTQAEASYDAFDGHKAHLKAFEATPPLDEFHHCQRPRKPLLHGFRCLGRKGITS